MHDIIRKDIEKHYEMLERIDKILFSLEDMGIDTKQNEMYQALRYVLGETNEIKMPLKRSENENT